MKSTIYTMVVKDNIPEIMPISQYGTLRMPDGQSYWIVPIDIIQHESELKPSEELKPTSNSIDDKVLSYFKEGRLSSAEIGRKVGISGTSVSNIIRNAGLETGSDVLRKIVKEALLNAGTDGATPHFLAGLCPPGQRLGPVITSMIKRGVVRRLTNGNYSIV